MLFFIVLLAFGLSGCSNKGDYVDIHNQSPTIFDNIRISVKDGYFYEKHEKSTIDDDTIALTIYFSDLDSTDDGWE